MLLTTTVALEFTGAMRVNFLVMRFLFALAACCLLSPAVRAQHAAYVPSSLRPPAPPREFRGVWVATVNNIDWPSRKDLSAAQQKAELIALLDRAAQLRLNAVLFQVRPACDALYASRFEPWSEYLTGQMGRAPKPFYDPLEFAIAEAHKRGLELHAWFNPFRARHSTAESPVSRNHISKTRPGLVLSYGRQLWLDPGQREAHELSLKVILDVVKRYDIDGVHMDDYFYPYPERGAGGRDLPFPDAPSWRRYVAAGGRLSRDDWRRNNVDSFVHRLNQAVHAAKPHVKFSVSPFGIWRPGFPAQIRGLDAYESLYADSRKWLAGGWLDFFVPQLYWPSKEPAQSFPVLLHWWAAQNSLRRHVWPGIAVTRVTNPAWGADEILRQINTSRSIPGARGQVFWNMGTLRRNSGGLADALPRRAYIEPALTPEYPWLVKARLGPPKLATRDAGREGLRLSWTPAGASPHRWLLQQRRGGVWRWQTLPGHYSSLLLDSRAGFPEAIAVTGLDRVGNSGASAVLQRVVR